MTVSLADTNYDKEWPPNYGVWTNEWDAILDRYAAMGVDLANPDGTEATEICAYVKNRMRDHRILIGSEGPKDNILKIRPPLTIEADDIAMLLTCLDGVLSEVALWQS